MSYVCYFSYLISYLYFSVWVLKFCLVRVIVVSQEHREAKDHKATKYVLAH